MTTLPKNTTADHGSMDQKQLEGCYLTDTWHQTTKTYDLINPATGEAFANAAACSATEAKAAIDIAWQTFTQWRTTTVYERAAILRQWHDLILANKDFLAGLMAAEMGKPITEAKGEIDYAASFVAWYAEEAKRSYGSLVPATSAKKRILVRKSPVGPCFAITPWNFPAAMITRKAAPALAAGCTVMVKPAQQTPLSALALAKLWEDAGGPAGTLQVLPTEDAEAVSTPMFDDARIRKLTFTGSTKVGKLLYKQAADTVKRLSLELGGHAPYLIFASANIDDAVKNVMACKFRNAGQTCICTNRIYVQDSIFDTFTATLKKAVEALTVGDPTQASTDIGPLVNKDGLEKVQNHVQDAQDKGATLLTGGQSLDGLYYQPTVLTDVTADMLMMQEETFGPVAPVARFSSTEEAIRLANDTPYGLAAYLYTEDLSQAFWVSEALEYGIVGVNDGGPSSAQAPFGGFKESGLGREGGKWGIEEYLETQYISIGLKHPPQS